MMMNRLVLWAALVGLPGCAAFSGLMGPTDAQLTACAGVIDTGLKAGTITKALAETYSAQMHAVPASLPQPCAGKV
jgi:hypothetical protein